MAIIYTYGYDSNINGADALIGTDSTGRKTKQFRVSDLTSYISENIAVVAGVNTITTTDSTFISLTPSTPQNGDVTITSTLSATGTPDETTYLRGDNTWATIPDDTDNYVDSISFNTGSGELTLGRTGVLPDLVQSLDGRYALAGSGLTGSGTTNYVAKWSAADTLTDSVIYNNGTNVGIGTASPIAPLHVIGDTIIEDSTATLTIKSTQIGSFSSIAFESLANSGIGGGGSTDHLSFYTASNTRMRILANGNVGIGTSSPTQALHVNGSVRISDVIYDSSNSPGTAGQVLYKPTNDTIGWVNRDSITSIPTSITATPGGTLSLASNIDFVYFTWSGGSGTYTLNLPIASTHAYKIIRFVCDSTISANDKIHIQGSLGDTVDGGLFYTLNKPYNGVQVWSDGSEWMVIQAKAT
jgi:hypothetical protein